MLSIGAMGGGQENYYLTLAREDYYTAGGEPPGAWLGRAAKHLGLTGQVQPEQLRALFHGRSPTDAEPLVQLQNGRTHQPGWDLTFSAPKSVSVAWSQADYELRQAMQQAHLRAVQCALDYLEQNAAFTRRGKGGVEAEHCGVLVAAFEHGTSRAQDPQLHTHALLLNVVVRADGTFGTLRSHDFYVHKMMAGALYRAHLGYEMERLGFELTRGEYSFELACVPKALSEHFSKRRQEILEAMSTQGLSGPVAASLAVLSTRQVKGHVAREDLLGRWRLTGEEFGFSSKEVLAGIQERRPDSNRDKTLHLATGKAIKSLSDRQGSFPEADLLRRVAHAVEDKGFSGYELARFVRSCTKGEKLVVVHERSDYLRFATKEALATEKRLLEAAERSKTDRTHLVPEKIVSEASRKRTLNPEQDAALRHITMEPGSLKCVQGLAGTGKTHLLGTAREAWERQGFTVMGCALAARAARQLEEGSGIKSYTLASVLHHLEQDHARRPASLREAADGLVDAAKDEVRRAAAQFGFKTHQEQDPARRPTSFQEAKDGVLAAAKGELREAARQFGINLPQKNGPPPLTANTVLVLDEAGMVDTRQMEKLVTAVTDAKAKLVLVGDTHQLQAIEGGAPFRLLSERLGAAELSEVVRQYEPWMAHAVKQFAEGDAQGALTQYALADKLHVQATRGDAIQKLISDWTEKRTHDLRETIILAGTREDVANLNRQAQESRRESGELGEHTIHIGGTLFHEGDRVLFTSGNRAMGVLNGDFGVIENIQGVSSPRTSLSVLLDREDEHGRAVRVTFTPISCGAMELGYAATTHKLQGGTVDRTFVLAGGWTQDRHLSYVQMSRHREDCHIYAAEADCGEHTEPLAKAMSRDRSHGMVLDAQPEHDKQERSL